MPRIGRWRGEGGGSGITSESGDGGGEGEEEGEGDGACHHKGEGGENLRARKGSHLKDLVRPVAK